MRFMIIVKATPESERGVMPGEALIAAIADYQEQFAKAGVLLEALEWSRRFPNPTIDGSACEIEVRQIFELEDFGDSRAAGRFRDRGVLGSR